MARPVTMDDIYAVVTGGADPQSGDSATTYRAIARRLGRDEGDPQVHELIKAMAVSGYLKQGPLGGLQLGPTRMPDSEGSWRRREYDDCVREGGQPMTLLAPPGEWPNGPVEVSAAELDDAEVWFALDVDPWSFHIKAWNDHRKTRCHAAGWIVQYPALNEAEVWSRGGYCCANCVTIVRRNDPGRAEPSAVIPGVEDDEALVRADMAAGPCTYNLLEIGGPHAFTNVRPPDGQEGWDTCGQPQSAGVHDPLQVANRQQASADRAFAERLDQSAAAGNLTQHSPDDACSLGLWHEGPCPDVSLERQLQLDDEAEDRGVSRDDMDTCGVHRQWFKDCVAVDPRHSNPVTKFNWCKMHWCPVHECRCWTPNVDGVPQPGDEPRHTDEDWVDWMLDPRTHPDGTRGGMSIETRQGNIRVVPDGDEWIVFGPYGLVRRKPTKHEGLLAAVDGEVHPDAVRRPKARPGTSAVVDGVA